FWPTLHRSGFTERVLRPDEQERLLGLGLGVTNIVARATARADELRPEELLAGARPLQAKITPRPPRGLAAPGGPARPPAFGRRHATVGPQDEVIGGTRVWVLPNPSGLNAHYVGSGLADAFRELRLAEQHDDRP